MWEQWLSAVTNAVFVAEQDGVVVGFVNVGPCDHLEGVGELYAIYVHPEAWSTGAGLALMEAGVELARGALAGRDSLGGGGQSARAPASTSSMAGSPVSTRVVEVLPGAARPRGALPALRPRPSLG